MENKKQRKTFGEETHFEFYRRMSWDHSSPDCLCKALKLEEPLPFEPEVTIDDF